MSLTKLSATPDQANYAAQDGNDVNIIQLDGGAARYQRDILKTTSLVTVEWTVGNLRFQYIRAFYNTVTVRGSLPFLIDLILDQPSLTEHTAHFVPGTMKHAAIGGSDYTVSAQLEVQRIDDDDAYNESFVVLVNTFGFDDALIDAGLLSLEYLANTAIPDALSA